MMSAVDKELLITLVGERFVLWDKSNDDYEDRNLTRYAWENVYKVLNKD